MPDPVWSARGWRRGIDAAVGRDAGLLPSSAIVSGYRIGRLVGPMYRYLPDLSIDNGIGRHVWRILGSDLEFITLLGVEVRTLRWRHAFGYEALMYGLIKMMLALRESAPAGAWE